MKKLFKKDSGEEHNFWMSYTDLMSGFLIVFIILSAILFNHFTKKADEAEAARVKYDELIEKYNKAIYELENSGRDIDSCLVANSKLKSRVDSLTYVVDSLRKNDMKNLITQYRSVFVYDPNIKVNLSNKDMELFNKVREYYYRELAYEGREMDIIYIYDTYILYVTESRYFGIIYSRDGKEHKYTYDIKINSLNSIFFNINFFYNLFI